MGIEIVKEIYYVYENKDKESWTKKAAFCGIKDKYIALSNK